MRARILKLIYWPFALAGYALWMLDDTASWFLHEFLKQGLTVDRVIALFTLSGVTAIAVRGEKILARFRSVAKDIRAEVNQAIGKLTGRVHSQQKEIKELMEQTDELGTKQSKLSSEVSTVRGLFIDTMKLVIEQKPK